MVNVPTPETGSMGGVASHHKSVTFNKPSGTMTKEDLEKKVKEMEEKKSQAEEALKQSQAKVAANKKEDAGKSVSITA